MSNIQSLSHIDQSKTAQAIKLLKYEIEHGSPAVVEETSNVISTHMYCKNEFTSVPYDIIKGTPEEKELFRVMPLDGVEKIYFNSKDEYSMWYKKNQKHRNMY